ncbi:hypothetical protein BH20BAC1_BH20BAC1_00420 [soil metagenome]
MGLRFFFFILAIFLLLPNFFNFSIEANPVYNKRELFDPAMKHLNSLDKILAFADSLATANNIPEQSPQYGILVANIIRERFYHGFSVYNLRENWIAALLHSGLGKNLANPVDPADILQYPYAGCSQQAIVLMKAMHIKNIPYRSLGFPHHYAVELFIQNSWYFFDPDMEPKMQIPERNEDQWQKSPDSLKKYYHFNMAHLNWGLGSSENVQIGVINAEPAPNALLFQQITKVLSKTLWLIPLMFAFCIRIKPPQCN